VTGGKPIANYLKQTFLFYHPWGKIFYFHRIKTTKNEQIIINTVNWWCDNPSSVQSKEFQFVFVVTSPCRRVRRHFPFRTIKEYLRSSVTESQISTDFCFVNFHSRALYRGKFTRTIHVYDPTNLWWHEICCSVYQMAYYFIIRSKINNLIVDTNNIFITKI
jgi:hypothetical protein